MWGVSKLGLLMVAPAALLLGGCGAPGTPAMATVTLIDRKCEIIETIDTQVDEGDGVKLKSREMNSKTGECKSVEEWDEVREKRKKDVKGTAEVHVEYQAPQDGSYRQGTLTFTGRDEEFYDLNAGDSIKVIVANDDPAKIRKA